MFIFFKKFRIIDMVDDIVWLILVKIEKIKMICFIFLIF